jgi:hypothetical protein
MVTLKDRSAHKIVLYSRRYRMRVGGEQGRVTSSESEDLILRGVSKISERDGARESQRADASASLDLRHVRDASPLMAYGDVCLATAARVEKIEPSAGAST